MKKAILLFFLFATSSVSLYSQIDTTKIKLDLLRAPSSPAANLLGFATSDIQKPTDVTELMLTLQSATNNFSGLPSNYAVDIAPFQFFDTKNLTTDKLDAKSFGSVFKQSFLFSFGIRNPNTEVEEFNVDNFYNSLGFKFSLLRGNVDPETMAQLQELKEIQRTIAYNINLGLEDAILEDKQYSELRQQRANIIRSYNGDLKYQQDTNYIRIQNKMSQRHNIVRAEIITRESEKLEELNNISKKLKVERYGPFIDLAGGTSLEFVNRKFNHSRMYNAGAWLTFGHNGRKGLSALGLVRYLHNPDKIFADDAGTIKTNDISTLDGGGRLIYSQKDSRFRFSGEAIYRSALNKNTIDPSWRLIVNAEYDIGNNQVLTFSYGRNFDGVVTKDGNIIAALNFIKGFGGKR